VTMILFQVVPGRCSKTVPSLSSIAAFRHDTAIFDDVFSCRLLTSKAKVDTGEDATTATDTVTIFLSRRK
jgi:hypothetical protein